jgi:hypothetical protein
VSLLIEIMGEKGPNLWGGGEGGRHHRPQLSIKRKGENRATKRKKSDRIVLRIASKPVGLSD